MNDYKRAVRQIVEDRRDALDAGFAVWQAALASDEKLRSAYTEYQNEAIKSAQSLPNDFVSAKAKFEQNAARLGLKRETIEPPCNCKLCNDTGYANGGFCSCVIKRVINANAENLTLKPLDFEQNRKSAPKAIAKAYAVAKDYVDAFGTDKAKPFFIITGTSGTGKTMLASSVVGALMSAGAAAVTVTAFEFVKRAKDYHTQFAIDDYADLFTPMLDCDVLMIDDLGKETTLKNITMEYLYAVINERWIRRKHTIVTTNLTPSELIARYGEAIFSRLCDKAIAVPLNITAPNARLS